MFYSGTSCNGSFVYPLAFGGEFDWLAIQDIIAQLDALTASLNGTNATLQEQIDDLYNITYNISTNLSAVWDEINTIWDAINAMNHGTVNLYHFYNESLGIDLLNVWGEAPQGTTQAHLWIYRVDQVPFIDTPVYEDNVSIVNVSNQNAYYFTAFTGNPVDLTGPEFGPKNYNIFVAFEPLSLDYVVSTPFNDLFLFDLQEQVGDVRDDLEEINDTMHDINESLWNETQALWNETQDIWDTIDAMNHGTMFSRYFAGDETLKVWGEAPLGAGTIKLCLIEADLNSNKCADASIVMTTTATTNGLNRNYYSFNDVDVSGLDQTKEYIIKVSFGIPFGGQSVAAMLTSLSVENLQERVQNLENNVTALWQAVDDLENMSLITFDYFSAEYGGPSLDLYGYAPGDAQSVEIVFYGSRSGEEYSQCVPVDQAVSPEFSLDLDLSDWEIDSYAIEGYFYDQPGCSGKDVEPMAYGNTFDDLLNDWFHENELGFGLMDTQTFEVWNPQESFTRKMSWAFTAPEDGLYWFELVNPTSDNGEDISKEFAGGNVFWINSHETKYFKNRNVRFPPEEGSYKVKLKAHNAFTGETIKSNAFRLIIDDLAHPWPAYNVSTVSVTPDEGNYAEGVYWTANPIVWMAGILGNNTEWMNDLRCEVWNYKEEAQAILAERWDLLSYTPFGLSEENATYCSGDLNLTELDPLIEGGTPQYIIELCAHPVSGQVECDRVTFGYDTTPPAIDEESLNPGTLDAVRGVWNFSADVTDDGVISRVWFTLTNKTNASQVCQLGDANNTEGDTWLVQYNTTGNCTPDGYYNFTVYAIDYAGNEANLTIDPIIDNTPPVVQSVDVSGYVGSGWTVTSEITDNLAGVDQASAYVYEMNCSDFESTTYTAHWCKDSTNGNSTTTNCSYTSECSTDNTGGTIADCVSSCSGNGTPQKFVKIENCAESCYAHLCNASEAGYNYSYTAEQNCLGTFECTLPENASPVITPFSLTRTAGDKNNGTWTGSINGSALDSDKHYTVKVIAYDKAGNQNNASEGATSFDLYSHVGYTVTVDAATTSPQYAGSSFTVSGTVVASDGSNPEGSVVLSPWSVSTPLLMGAYTASESLGPGNGQVITATYTPDAACDESFSGTTSVDITPVARSGGGGGGGACGALWECGSWSECSPSGTQTRSCTDKNSCGYDDGRPSEERSCVYHAPSSSRGGSSVNTLETTGGSDTGTQESTGTQEQPPATEPQDNGLTGAVTGNPKAASLTWLWVLVGLIVLAAGGWLLFRRK